MNLDVLAAGFLLSLSLCMDIGIVNVAIIDTAMRRGIAPAFWLGVGSCIGDLVYAALSAAGVGWLLQFPAARWVIWIGGTATLVWLAARMVREAIRDAGRPETEDVHAVEVPAAHLLRRGALLALASPTSILWFAAAGAALIAQATAGDVGRVPVFLLGFFVGGVAWSTVLAFVMAKGGAHLGRRLRQGCHIASAALFVYFALSVGREAVRAIAAL